MKDSLQSKNKIEKNLRNFNVSPLGMENKLPLAGFSVLEAREVDTQSNQNFSQECQSSIACGKSVLLPSNYMQKALRNSELYGGPFPSISFPQI